MVMLKEWSLLLKTRSGVHIPKEKHYVRIPNESFWNWVRYANFAPAAVAEYFCEEGSTGVFLTKEEADKYLSMVIDKEPARDENNSFIEHTAKALAIHMVFEQSETEATELFQKLQEPLSSRVFYYLTHLRGVYSTKL